uniref:Uncharacterized protein n=1 Tax=Anopheles culicifacies TaxID=139723 RepID=A0A182M2K9_9DIPT
MAPVRDTRWYGVGVTLLAVTLAGWCVEAAEPTDSYRLTESSSSASATTSTKETVSTSTSSTSTDATINRCRAACLTKTVDRRLVKPTLPPQNNAVQCVVRREVRRSGGDTSSPMRCRPVKTGDACKFIGLAELEEHLIG